MQAPAKINLVLDVKGKLPNGYHLVEMVMQTIGLADTLTFTEARQTTLTADCGGLALDSTNLIIKAWQLMRQQYQLDGGLAIQLEKRIPMAAGLAGGSANAAATIRAVDQIFGLKRPLAELQALALQLGADVPFCLQGGTVLAEGIGEKLTQQPPCPRIFVLVVNPGFAVNTGSVYQALEIDKLQNRPRTNEVLAGIATQDIGKILANTGNVLEGPAFRLFPQLTAIKAQVAACGLTALMSGSGGTILGLAAEQGQVAAAAKRLRGVYPFVETTVII